MKTLSRPLFSALLALGAFAASSILPAQGVIVDPPPWKFLWIGSDNPADTWNSTNSRNPQAIFGNWGPINQPAPDQLRPNSGSCLVIVDPAQTANEITGERNCRLGVSDTKTAGRVVLAPGTSLTLQNRSLLFITSTPHQGYPTFAGAGDLLINGDLRINPGATLNMDVSGMIGGNGTITMSPGDANDVASALHATTLSVTLNLSAGLTVRGAGDINSGNGAVILNNAAVLDANVAGQTLSLFTSGQFGSPPSVNTGTFRASNGGTLNVFNGQRGVVQNAGGRFEALDGSTVRLAYIDVIGGTFATAGSGAIRSALGYVQNVSNTGLIQVGDDARGSEFLGIKGTFSNSGTVRVGGENNQSASYINFFNDLTLSGGGRLVLRSGSPLGGTGTRNLTLTNPAGATIEGAGRLCFPGGGGFDPAYYSTVANAGLIDANVPGQPMQVGLFDAENGRLVNSATVRASGGGVLGIYGLDNNNRGTLDNTGGRIEALAGSVVQVRGGALVKGGTLAAVGTGVVRVGQNNVFSGGILRDLTTSGPLELSYGFFEGSVTNSGTATLAAAEFTFTSATFTNQAGATFALVDGTGISGTGTINNAGSFIRSGPSGSTMQAGISFVNTGSVVIGDSLCQFGNYSQSAGSLRFTSGGRTQTNTGQPLVFTGGSISGTGTVTGSLTNNGNLTVGGDLNATILTISNNYAQSAGATLTVNASGSAASPSPVLTVQGSATLAGNIAVALSGPPNTGQIIRVLETPNGNDISGTFTGQPSGSILSVPYGGYTFQFRLDYTSSFVRLTHVNAPAVNFNYARSFWFTPAELSNPAISGPTADPFGRGVPNLLAYALGEDPRTVRFERLPRSSTRDVLGSPYSVLEIRRAIPLRPDLRYLVSEATSLATGFGTPVDIDLPANAGRILSRTDNGDGTETVVVRASGSIGSNPKRFLRFTVTYAP